MLQLVWTWQPALYLFLGGMGSGAFIMATGLFLMDKTRHRLIVSTSMWAAVISLGVGLMLLVLELINPLRGILLWQSFSHFTSWMTYGAWGAFCALVVWTVSAFIAVPSVNNRLVEKWGWYKRHGTKIRAVLGVIGAALAVFVAAYTGMLLKTAGGVPLWDTPLLPCLFTVSAFDTGVALVEVVAVVLSKKDPLAHHESMIMKRIVVVLVVLELAVLWVFLWVMLSANPTTSGGQAAASSAGLLVNGSLSVLFWSIVVVCGLVIPLTMAICGLAMGERNTRHVMAFGAVGALVGGCGLRFLILAAGIHADVIGDTMSNLLL
ncbi:Formate-dependent nitrite reductase, membrane component [Slackia heliotrinireducens]|uniref:Formate-dependent nitrite reductase, membrane component n=1 Tax=Slackia heliotrinireducens (strain ATCC 29202 / DSM 20476 / NCTC 11029 / RHS 1) TaxID=471855 RepID=C7N273_SLAHD|nr:NrfD/PsrC family molybdoenzyme membrane anchor subunit [Slackia heliotrinireducens]ACV21379.1 formate-dependent nitrite reductase, membrane component [Slackia heliotrinireducens DSM 20476]VEG98811.1 Formate-dependent nitrite reductase, membrane component [Slackia heliotrinireducens]